MTTECPARGAIAVDRTYLRGLQAPAVVRGFVRAQLLVWALPRLVDTTELIASELVTNAVQNGLGDLLAVRLECSGESVCIRVWDGNPDPPRPVTADADEEHGRGLMITDALSDRWGSYPLASGGKVVYAVITGDAL